jgi:hypothetical protein
MKNCGGGNYRWEGTNMAGERERRKCWYVSPYVAAYLETDVQMLNCFEEYLSFSVLQNSKCSAIDCSVPVR